MEEYVQKREPHPPPPPAAVSSTSKRHPQQAAVLFHVPTLIYGEGGFSHTLTTLKNAAKPRCSSGERFDTFNGTKHNGDKHTFRACCVCPWLRFFIGEAQGNLQLCDRVGGTMHDRATNNNNRLRREERQGREDIGKKR